MGRTTISIPTSRAFREIFCAGQTGFVCTECGILPIREVATYPRSSACDHPSSGERSTARRSLPAREPVSKFCWEPVESQQHNQPERRSDEFDADVVSFQVRFLLQELNFAHCPYQPRRPIRGNFLTKSDWLVADTECDILLVRIRANY